MKLKLEYHDIYSETLLHDLFFTYHVQIPASQAYSSPTQFTTAKDI
jgi:hypothetical protein